MYQHDLNKFLLENPDAVDAQLFKEYCADEDLKPKDVFDRFYQEVNAAVECLYENACEKFNDEIDGFDYGDIANFNTPHFVDAAMLIDFVKQQARNIKAEK